jgi:hypothetical protein
VLDLKIGYKSLHEPVKVESWSFTKGNRVEFLSKTKSLKITGFKVDMVYVGVCIYILIANNAKKDTGKDWE